MERILKSRKFFASILQFNFHLCMRHTLRLCDCYWHQILSKEMLALNQAFFLLLQITVIKVLVCAVNAILLTSVERN